MNELWKPVPGFGGRYEASSLGFIRSSARSTRKVLNGTIKKHGHAYVSISVDKRRYSIGAHRLVLLAFCGPCPDGMEDCHNNGIADDNRPENLRWDTHHNNNQDRRMHGTYAVGEDHPMAKLSEAAVRSALD